MKSIATNLQQARIRAENELQLLFQQQHEFKRRAYPEWATYDGDHRFDDRLTDLSGEAEAMRQQKNKGFLKQAEAISPELLSPESQLNQRLFQNMLREEIDFHSLGLHLWAIDQQEGMHLKFPQLVGIQPLESYEQFEQYFSRLRSFEKQVEDTLANLREGLQRGLTLPRSVVLQSLAQMQELASSPLDQMPLFLPVLEHEAALPADLRQRVEELASKIISERVQPAYARLHAFVQQDYLPACREDGGLCALSNGEALYAYWIRRHTHTDLSAETIHALGQQEVERLLQALQTLTSRLNLPADLPALQQHLRSCPDYYYTEPEAMLQDYQQMLDQAQAVLGQCFETLPESPCVLKAIEAWRAAAAPQAYYYPPPQALSRPGIFYVNTSMLSERPRFSMMALTLHEAVPGHHLQLARALELKGLPGFRYHLESTSFVEGWALYAEALGEELGLYQDPLQKLGALAFELWRACRLVVDTGLHALGWSRAQAVQYFRAHTLQSEADIQSEIDRYIVLPGQALAYKVGELRLRELRQQAEARLGEAFELKAFHEVLLSAGSLPLDEISRRVAHWLETEAQSAAAKKALSSTSTR
ncbi:MAG: DUF885 domain-containing protein [Candidatus Sericytochromatia bacterium]|nr:DUF885 domain-containing protein [Candidatus Sericytochromatia bacterium]